MKIHPSARRRTRHLHVQTDAPAEAERLHALTSVLEATLAADDHPPTLVVALDQGDEVEVRLRDLDHHPATELEGFVAPPSWWCLGVISGADARPFPTWPAAGPETGPDRFRVHLAHLMTRTGLSARALRDRRTDEVVVHGAEADTGPAAAAGVGAEHGGGLLDDYLRCALGVPTPPPHRSTAALFTALWIHGVMTDAAAHRLLHAPWAAVAALHPVLQVPFQDDHPLLHDWAVANLVRAGELLAEAHPWDRVRLACQQGVGPVTGRPAELAGWFDEGAFARAVLSGFAPLEDLLADLHDLLRPEVHVRLVDTVGAWGLLDGP